jgi:hypothetical protein
MSTPSGFGMIHKDTFVMEYLESLTDQERKTFQIAQEHLETSFNIYKSIGFLKWKSDKDQDQDQQKTQ